jgi:hypothetical protein
MRYLFLLLFFAGASAQAQTYHFPAWSLTADAKGFITSFKDNHTGINYIIPGQPAPLVSIKTKDTLLLPQKARYSNNFHQVQLEFERDIIITVRITEKKNHLTFEITGVKNEDRIDALVWGPYPNSIGESVGETIGITQNKDFTLGLQALNLKTLGGYPWNDNDHLPQLDALSQPGYENFNEPKKFVLYSVEAARPAWYGSSLQAYTRNRNKDRVIVNWGYDTYTSPAYRDGGLKGSKIALFGCATENTLNSIEEIELAEGLPHPTINGQWVKKSAAINSSYLIMDFTEANMDSCIAVVRKSGLHYLYHGHPFTDWGHFNLIKEEFPNGWAGMKKCVQQAEAAGIYTGTHVLSNFITTNDAYVTPVPDKRLATAGSSILKNKISTTDTLIEIADPLFFNQHKNDNLHTVMIGQELIRYSTVSSQAPWVLKDCVRGAFGTMAAAHAPGDPIAKLADHGYKVFLGNMDLNQEIARKIASFMNYTGVRMLDFDGLEGNHSSGYGNYGEALFAKAWYDQLQPSVKNHFLLGASRSGHYFWHIYSRMNWGEPWYAGFRESQTEYRLFNQKYYKRNLMPGMLGWFRMTASTTTEDIEWLMARSASYNAGFAFVTDLNTIRQNGASDQIFSILNTWENARLEGKFSQVQMERMKPLENEYKLKKTTTGDFVLTPVYSYKFSHVKKTLQPGQPGFSSYSIENKAADQPLRFIITATDETISALKIEMNGAKTLEIPITLEKGQTLKYTEGTDAVLYDQRWQILRKIPINASLLQCAAGNQQVQVDCRFEGTSENPKVKLEFLFYGPADKLEDLR